MAKPRQYTEVELEMAVEAIIEGRMGAREAERIYDIPYSTLQRRAKSKQTKFMQPGRKPVLGFEMEKHLVTAILDSLDTGYSLSRKDVLELAKQLDTVQPTNQQVFKKELPSDMWYSRFMRRHRLSLHSSRRRASASKQQNACSVEVRDQLFDSYSKLLAQLPVEAQQIYNMDETELQIVTGQPEDEREAPNDAAGLTSADAAEHCATVSVACCANAAGCILPPFVVFRGGYSLTTPVTDFPADTTFAASDSECTAPEPFLRWLCVFDEKIPPKRPVLLVVGGGAEPNSPLSEEATRFCQQKEIHVFRLPPNSAHFRPMAAVFKSLQRKLQLESAKFARKGRRAISRTDFGRVFTPAYDAALSPMNVMIGFRKTGLWPLDRHAVVAREAEPQRPCGGGIEETKTDDLGPFAVEGHVRASSITTIKAFLSVECTSCYTLCVYVSVISVLIPVFLWGLSDVGDCRGS